MRKHKYKRDDIITVMHGGEEVQAKVRDTDTGSQPYYVKFQSGKSKGDSEWINVSAVIGGAWDETPDKFAPGDEVRFVADYDREYGKVLKGAPGTVVLIDEHDPTLHYKVRPTNLTQEQKDTLPEYYWNSERYPTDGIWVRETDLEATDDLPSYNPGATVSESMGMWRPPKVTP